MPSLTLTLRLHNNSFLHIIMPFSYTGPSLCISFTHRRLTVDTVTLKVDLDGDRPKPDELYLGLHWLRELTDAGTARHLHHIRHIVRGVHVKADIGRAIAQISRGTGGKGCGSV